MIAIRPVYRLRHRRMLAPYLWGVFVDGILCVVTRRYPSDLIRRLT